MIDFKYLPLELEKHRDKVLYLNKKWIIIDGVDVNGNPLGLDKTVSVFYHDYGFYVEFWCSLEVFKDREFFWKWVRSRVASKLHQLRKEIEK